MLNIYYGDMEEAVYNTAVYFKNTYEDNWITEPIVRDIIKDVDKSEVIDSNLIESPVLGQNSICTCKKVQCWVRYHHLRYLVEQKP